ncbi:MAG: HNH endonuclease signature motif containing protein [Cyanobacteria bacterium J06573_11]
MSVFEALISKLLPATKQADQSMEQLKQVADSIHKRYEPRLEFDRWKQTLGGRKWKRSQLKLQQGLCNSCRCRVKLKGSHIDHIKPLKHYPQLAIDPSNLQILCSDCNLRKGQQASVQE